MIFLVTSSDFLMLHSVPTTRYVVLKFALLYVSKDVTWTIFFTLHVPNFFSVLYLHRKAHALCTSYSLSRNLRPMILDGNSYIDSLSNHWSTYAIAHARFRDTGYEVPANNVDHSAMVCAKQKSIRWTLGKKKKKKKKKKNIYIYMCVCFRFQAEKN